MSALLAAALAAALATNGKVEYETRCATCHGVDLGGGPNAPSIRGVGRADVDFWLETGRMPAQVPWVQIQARGAQLPEKTIAAIVAYVIATAPGGPDIPVVSLRGRAERGLALFRENCAGCHGAQAEGASIGFRDWAPALDRTAPLQIAEAVRAGPGEMPAFGAAQFPQRDLDDVVTYVVALQHEARDRIPFTSSGPVPEGILGWLVAALLAFAAYAYSIRPKAERGPASPDLVARESGSKR